MHKNESINFLPCNLIILQALLLIINVTNAEAQFNYKFEFDTVRVDEKMRLHSFSYGRVGDLLFVFGGRKDGVHNKSGGFELKGAQRDLIVYNHTNNSSQVYSLQSLDTSIIDAIGASNANFTQRGSKLYIIGGYSENTVGNFITYPSLIIVNLDSLSKYISNPNISVLNNSFKQVLDTKFAVAGGQLKILDNNFFLVGGHKFSGIYNANATTFQQTYTESCFIFDVLEANKTIDVNWKNTLRDELNFHRRDFNLAPFFVTKDKLELMSFSGVFLPNVASPYLNISSINENGFTDIRDINQVLANYQCARVGFYSNNLDRMHEIFFGGMAVNFYNVQNQEINDPLVPFVNTVSRIDRNELGQYKEIRHTERMPGFLGTNSEFIINSKIAILHDEIIALDALSQDTTEIGNLLGGIYNYSQRLNPWQDSMIQLTTTNPYLIKVKIIKSNPNSVQNSSNKNYQINQTYENSIHKIKITPEFKNLNYWLISPDGKIILQGKESHNNELILKADKLLLGNYRLALLIDGIFQKSIGMQGN